MWKKKVDISGLNFSLLLFEDRLLIRCGHCIEKFLILERGLSIANRTPKKWCMWWNDIPHKNGLQCRCCHIWVAYWSPPRSWQFLVGYVVFACVCMCLPSLPIIFTTKKTIARIHQDTESKNAPPIVRTAVLDPQTSSVGNGDVTAVDGTSGKIIGNLSPGTVAVPERYWAWNSKVSQHSEAHDSLGPKDRKASLDLHVRFKPEPPK